MSKKAEHKNVSPAERRKWKIWSAIIIGIFGIVIWSIANFFYVGSPKEIISVANKFQPGPGWQLKQEHVEPPRGYCGDVDCPYVSRRWTLSQEVNREQFEKIVQIDNQKLKISDNCFEKTESGSNIESCDANGTIDNFHISLTYTGSHYSDGKPSITLGVGKER